MASKIDKIKSIEESGLKKDRPDINVGDTVSIHVKIVEDEKTRTQVFEGLVISKKGSGLRSALTVRKISFGEGVERTFPLHSPFVQKIAVKKKGRVKKSKLYYLRNKVGKATRIDEKLASEFESENAPPREEGEDKGV